MKQRGKKFWLYVSVGVLVLVIAAIWLFHGKGGGQAGPGVMAPQEAEPDVVAAENPSTGNLSITTGLTGTLESADVVYVYAKAGGDVTDVKIKAGDTVEQGQLLFEIDTEQVETAKNSLDSASLNLDEARSTLNRMQILYNAGDLSDSDYEQYTNAVKSAELQYESAKLAYDKQVEYSSVTAPISGVIESCSVEVYDRVSQNSELCVISGEGEKKISFYITERMLENVRVGDSVTVTKNGKSYEARVTEVNTMVDSSTGLFKAEAQMADTDEIATGSTVKLSLVTDRAENAMLIPIDAVYYSGGEAYVYLYEDGAVHMAYVEVGLTDSDYAEILSGLEADDMVVTTWSSNLYEGAKVQLKESGAAETGAGETEESAEETAGEETVSETAAEQEG